MKRPKAFLLSIAVLMTAPAASAAGESVAHSALFKSHAVIKDCADCPPLVLVPGVPTKAGIGPSFYVGQYELTWKEYLVAVREANCPAPLLDPGKPYDITDSRLDDDHPVTGVSYDDFNCYLTWISKKTGHQYRIPTASEWEHFARAGSKARYPWGDELGQGNAIVNGHFDAGWARSRRKYQGIDPRSDVRFGGLYPVGLMPPNAWGIYDVIGNVPETTSGTTTGPEVCLRRRGAKSCRLVVVRGGGIDLSLSDNPLTEQIFNFASSLIYRGYRVVRDN